MDADMLADLRSDAIAELEDNADGTTATVYSFSQNDTALGGEVQDFTAGATYPCLLQQGRRIPRETEQGEQIVAMADYTAKLPWNAGVHVVDRLFVGGSFYEVLGVNNDQGERITLEVDLKRPNE